jgi:hypothetical protein
MEYTVAGGPHDISARPSKKAVLSSRLIDRTRGVAPAPIGGGGGTMTDALLSERRWMMDWTRSTSGISVKKLGLGVIRVPGIILPSLKGHFGGCRESGEILR